MRSCSQQTPDKDARWIGKVGGSTDGHEVEVLMRSVQPVQLPTTCRGTAFPCSKAPVIEVLAPVGRHDQVGHPTLEPPEVAMLNFRVDGAPTSGKPRQPTGPWHERCVHRHHAVFSGHVTAPAFQVANRMTKPPLAAPCTRCSGDPCCTTRRQVPVTLLVEGANFGPVGQQQHVLRASVPEKGSQGPDVRRMVQHPTRRHMQRWGQRHIGPPTGG